MSQEFQFQLEQKQLHAGIKRHSGYIVPAVEEAYNLEVSPTGLVPYTPLEMLYEFTPEWPFPWLMGGAGMMFTVDKINDTTGSLEVWEGTDSTHIADLTFPSMTLYDLPDLAVFDTYRVLTGTFGVRAGIGDDLAVTTDIPKARSCCNYKGQLVLGGILEEFYDCDETFVAFSNIGDITMVPDWKNEAGYRPINYVGRVYRVRRLGDHVAVYGEHGVVLLSGVSSPTPTLGMQEIEKIKMASPAAADGGFRWHVVVDDLGYLWQISPEGAQNLGYRDAISQMTLSLVVVTYDPVYDRVFISDGDLSFVMTDNGLTQVYQIVSGVAGYQGTGYFVGDEDNEDYRLVVGPFDFGYNALKTVYTVESDTGDFVGLQVPVSGEYTLVKTVPLNDVGVGMPIVAGKSFMVVVTGEDFNEHPNHILLRWKMSDLRGVRGYFQPRQS
jgi:hypothetical protein